MRDVETTCGDTATRGRLLLGRVAATLVDLAGLLRETAEGMALVEAGEAVHSAGGEVEVPRRVCERQGLASPNPALVTCGACAGYLEAAGERRAHGEAGLDFELRRGMRRRARELMAAADAKAGGWTAEDRRVIELLWAGSARFGVVDLRSDPSAAPDAGMIAALVAEVEASGRRVDL